MKTKKKLTLEFYQNLGKLFYAIAAADKKVHPEEFNKLKECVKQHWLNVDVLEDDYHTDAAYHIEIVFDWLNNGANEADMCFQDFVDYKKQNPLLFTKGIKKLIMETANAVAASFSGLNKSELMILAKLDIELKTMHSK